MCLLFSADDDHKSYKRADKTVKDSICGSKYPFTVTSSEERVYIRFKTGYRNVNKRGFVAGYVLYEPSKCLVSYCVHVGQKKGSRVGWGLPIQK
jgi:hypothetical protein